MTELILAHLQARLAQARSTVRPTHEKGSVTTEYVVLIAVIVTLALAVLAVLSAKLLAKANSIDLG